MNSRNIQIGSQGPVRKRATERVPTEEMPVPPWTHAKLSVRVGEARRNGSDRSGRTDIAPSSTISPELYPTVRRDTVGDPFGAWRGGDRRG